MQWDDLRIFLSLMSTRSLSTTARDLGVDRSTVSRRLLALERALGARLFLRSREGLRPLTAAERLRAPAERMAEEARLITVRGLAPDRSVEGLVRVATTEALATFLVQRGLLELRERHPALSLELLGGNQPVDLGRGEADIALRVRPPQEPALRVRRVAQMGCALYAAPAYTQARGAPRGEAELTGHEVLVPSGELSRLPEATWLTGLPGVRVALRSSSMPALVSAAVRGAGLVALTRPWGDSEPGLMRLFDLDFIPPRSLWIVTHPDLARRAAVRVVADWIASLMSGG